MHANSDVMPRGALRGEGAEVRFLMHNFYEHKLCEVEERKVEECETPDFFLNCCLNINLMNKLKICNI